MDKQKGANADVGLFEIRDREVEMARPMPEAWTKEALMTAAAEAKEMARLQEEVIANSSRTLSDFPFVGASPLMLRVFELIDKVADTD